MRDKSTDVRAGVQLAIIFEAITPLFGTPDSDLFRGYSVRRTLVRGTPTKVQMVRVRRILCSARKKYVI